MVLVRVGGSPATGTRARAWVEGAAAQASDAEGTLVERPDLAGEPRVVYASRLREELAVFGYKDPRRSAVAVVGRGIGGLHEMSYELEAHRRGRGEGTPFLRAALRAWGTQNPLVACVAPGNVASLRILLACGFVPVGSLQLVRRRPGYVPSLGG